MDGEEKSQPPEMKEEPVEIIDLSETRTSIEIVYEWDLVVRRQLNQQMVSEDKDWIYEKMQWYDRQLTSYVIEFDDLETSVDKIVNHIKCLSSLYRRSHSILDDRYLDLMEEILVTYCNIVMKYVTEKRKSVKNREMKKIVTKESRRIKCLLLKCLMEQKHRLLHVLMKMDVDPTSQPCRNIITNVYGYFITRLPQDSTDENFLRGYIIFQKWKLIRKLEEYPTMDTCMFQLYKKTPEMMTTNVLFKRVLTTIVSPVGDSLFGGTSKSSQSFSSCSSVTGNYTYPRVNSYTYPFYEFKMDISVNSNNKNPIGNMLKEYFEYMKSKVRGENDVFDTGELLEKLEAEESTLTSDWGDVDKEFQRDSNMWEHEVETANNQRGSSKHIYSVNEDSQENVQDVPDVFEVFDDDDDILEISTPFKSSVNVTSRSRGKTKPNKKIPSFLDSIDLQIEPDLTKHKPKTTPNRTDDVILIPTSDDKTWKRSPKLVPESAALKTDNSTDSCNVIDFPGLNSILETKGSEKQETIERVSETTTNMQAMSICDKNVGFVNSENLRKPLVEYYSDSDEEYSTDNSCDNSSNITKHSNMVSSCSNLSNISMTKYPATVTSSPGQNTSFNKIRNDIISSSNITVSQPSIVAPNLGRTPPAHKNTTYVTVSQATNMTAWAPLRSNATSVIDPPSASVTIGSSISQAPPTLSTSNNPLLDQDSLYPLLLKSDSSLLAQERSVTSRTTFSGSLLAQEDVVPPKSSPSHSLLVEDHLFTHMNNVVTITTTPSQSNVSVTMETDFSHTLTDVLSRESLALPTKISNCSLLGQDSLYTPTSDVVAIATAPDKSKASVALETSSSDTSLALRSSVSSGVSSIASTTTTSYGVSSMVSQLTELPVTPYRTPSDTVTSSVTRHISFGASNLDVSLVKHTCHASRFLDSNATSLAMIINPTLESPASVVLPVSTITPAAIDANHGSKSSVPRVSPVAIDTSSAYKATVNPLVQGIKGQLSSSNVYFENLGISNIASVNKKTEICVNTTTTGSNLTFDKSESSFIDKPMDNSLEVTTMDAASGLITTQDDSWVSKSPARNTASLLVELAIPTAHVVTPTDHSKPVETTPTLSVSVKDRRDEESVAQPLDTSSGNSNGPVPSVISEGVKRQSLGDIKGSDITDMDERETFRVSESSVTNYQNLGDLDVSNVTDMDTGEKLDNSAIEKECSMACVNVVRDSGLGSISVTVGCSTLEEMEVTTSCLVDSDREKSNIETGREERSIGKEESVNPSSFSERTDALDESDDNLTDRDHDQAAAVTDSLEDSSLITTDVVATNMARGTPKWDYVNGVLTPPAEKPTDDQHNIQGAQNDCVYTQIVCPGKVCHTPDTQVDLFSDAEFNSDDLKSITTEGFSERNDHSSEETDEDENSISPLSRSPLPKSALKSTFESSKTSDTSSDESLELHKTALHTELNLRCYSGPKTSPNAKIASQPSYFQDSSAYEQSQTQCDKPNKVLSDNGHDFSAVCSKSAPSNQSHTRYGSPSKVSSDHEHFPRIFKGSTDGITNSDRGIVQISHTAASICDTKSARSSKQSFFSISNLAISSANVKSKECSTASKFERNSEKSCEINQFDRQKPSNIGLEGATVEASTQYSDGSNSVLQHAKRSELYQMEVTYEISTKTVKNRDASESKQSLSEERGTTESTKPNTLEDVKVFLENQTEILKSYEQKSDDDSQNLDFGFSSDSDQNFDIEEVGDFMHDIQDDMKEVASNDFNIFEERIQKDSKQLLLSGNIKDIEECDVNKTEMKIRKGDGDRLERDSNEDVTYWKVEDNRALEKIFTGDPAKLNGIVINPDKDFDLFGEKEDIVNKSTRLNGFTVKYNNSDSKTVKITNQTAKKPAKTLKSSYKNSLKVNSPEVTVNTPNMTINSKIRASPKVTVNQDLEKSINATDVIVNSSPKLVTNSTSKSNDVAVNCTTTNRVKSPDVTVNEDLDDIYTSSPLNPESPDELKSPPYEPFGNFLQNEEHLLINDSSPVKETKSSTHINHDSSPVKETKSSTRINHSQNLDNVKRTVMDILPEPTDSSLIVKNDNVTVKNDSGAIKNEKVTVKVGNATVKNDSATTDSLAVINDSFSVRMNRDSVPRRKLSDSSEDYDSSSVTGEPMDFPTEPVDIVTVNKNSDSIRCKSAKTRLNEKKKVVEPKGANNKRARNTVKRTRYSTRRRKSGDSSVSIDSSNVKSAIVDDLGSTCITPPEVEKLFDDLNKAKSDTKITRNTLRLRRTSSVSAKSGGDSFHDDGSVDPKRVKLDSDCDYMNSTWEVADELTDSKNTYFNHIDNTDSYSSDDQDRTVKSENTGTFKKWNKNRKSGKSEVKNESKKNSKTSSSNWNQDEQSEKVFSANKCDKDNISWKNDTNDKCNKDGKPRKTKHKRITFKTEVETPITCDNEIETSDEPNVKREKSLSENNNVLHSILKTPSTENGRLKVKIARCKLKQPVDVDIDRRTDEQLWQAAKLAFERDRKGTPQHSQEFIIQDYHKSGQKDYAGHGSNGPTTTEIVNYEKTHLSNQVDTSKKHEVLEGSKRKRKGSMFNPNILGTSHKGKDKEFVFVDSRPSSATNVNDHQYIYDFSAAATGLACETNQHSPPKTTRLGRRIKKPRGKD